MASICALDITA